MSKQPPPAPTASTIGPCPTFIQIVGRPGTGSIPSTIAPHDQLGPDFYGNKYVDEMFFFFLKGTVAVLRSFAETETVLLSLLSRLCLIVNNGF